MISANNMEWTNVFLRCSVYFKSHMLIVWLLAMVVSQGLGVVGARIMIDGRHVATTQQHGTYHLDSMKPGSYRLSVEAPRMTFDIVAVKVTPNTPQLPSIIAST